MKKYRPPNGTDGMIFMERFCDVCRHDEDCENPCPIIAETMLYDIDDPKYPSEWRYGENGKPYCSRFEPAD